MQTYASLLATNAREQWEKCFEQEYIQPVLAVSIGRDGENVRGVKTSCENSQSLMLTIRNQRHTSTRCLH